MLSKETKSGLFATLIGLGMVYTSWLLVVWAKNKEKQQVEYILQHVPNEYTQCLKVVANTKGQCRIKMLHLIEIKHYANN